MNAITFARYPTDYERDALITRATDRRFAGAVLIALLLALAGMSGCADCFKPAAPSYPSKGCQIARQAVDCTTAAAKAQAGSGAAIGRALIDTGTVDTGALSTSLIALGFTDAECILAAIFSDFSSMQLGPVPIPANVANSRLAFAANWRAHRVGQ